MKTNTCYKKTNPKGIEGIEGIVFSLFQIGNFALLIKWLRDYLLIEGIGEKYPIESKFYSSIPLSLQFQSLVYVK